MQDPGATPVCILAQEHPVTFTTIIMNYLPAPVLVRMTPPSVTLARMIIILVEPAPESDPTPFQEHYHDTSRDSQEVI